MSSRSYAETSVPVGALFIMLGVGIWLAHHFIGMFTTWTWAVLVGSIWIIAGSLLLFPDIRLYQYDQSPLEQLMLEGKDS
ncbi:MAG: hypothetical protein SVG88_14460 [Halobacteriales archaeon]|nr:hypothetical protein [Halobacteriales archaeon]